MPEAWPLSVSKRTTEWAKGYAGGRRDARPARTPHLRRGEASAPRILRISEDAALSPGLTTPTGPSSLSPSAPQGSALGLSGALGLGAPGQPLQGRQHSAPRRVGETPRWDKSPGFREGEQLRPLVVRRGLGLFPRLQP